MIKENKVIRVNEKEFELENGSIYLHPIELELREIPTVEEFQKVYDHWRFIFNEYKRETD